MIDQKSNKWKQIALSEATEHPLYGIKGWLIAFAIALLLGQMSSLGSVKGEAHKVGMTLSEFLSLDHPAASFVTNSLILSALSVGIIYWFLFTKHRLFRPVATWVLIGTYPTIVLIGLLNPFPGFGQVIASSFFMWIISCCVWVSYVNKSQRVRVTFENMVRTDFVENNNPESFVNSSSPNITSDHQNSSSISEKNTLKLARLDEKFKQHVGKSIVVSEDLWAQALAEYHSDARRPGLYARSFAEANGVEDVLKAAYLRSRVGELEKEKQNANKKMLQQNADEELAKEKLYELNKKIKDLNKCWWLTENEKSDFLKNYEIQKEKMKNNI